MGGAYNPFISNEETSRTTQLAIPQVPSTLPTPGNDGDDDIDEEMIDDRQKVGVMRPSKQNRTSYDDDDDNESTTTTIQHDTGSKISTPQAADTIQRYTSDQIKRKDSEPPRDEDSNSTPRPKKSRKLQGVGVKKPLYSRYESLFIIKAFKTVTERRPNLILTDSFKIVALLFNKEASRQGFKERTPDQLYQKYKRIQHGLNHGETEFFDFFKQNKYNPKEWLPDLQEAEKSDDILRYIKFPQFDESVNEVLGANNAKAPDLYEDEEDGNSASIGVTQNDGDVSTPCIKSGDTKEVAENGEVVEDEEILKLAGYGEVEHKDNGIKVSDLDGISSRDLKMRIIQLEERLRSRESEIETLKECTFHKDTEISFLKNMLKEDLSYIRHKLNETGK